MMAIINLTVDAAVEHPQSTILNLVEQFDKFFNPYYIMIRNI